MACNSNPFCRFRRGGFRISQMRHQKNRFGYSNSITHRCSFTFFLDNGVHFRFGKYYYLNNAEIFTFLILSGVATGASWICYFKALSTGDINKVVPIDKSGTIITVLLAIILFKETNHLAIKLIGTALLSVGVFLMIEKKNIHTDVKSSTWLPYAIGSALFAALTSILAKIGISDINSNLGTAIRTTVVLMMTWIVVLTKNKQYQLKNLDKTELVFIILSGLATGGSWLCYYYAIQKGIVSVVVPIDKLSILISIGFSYFVFKEKLSKKALVGLFLLVCGTLAMAIWA